MELLTRKKDVALCYLFVWKTLAFAVWSNKAENYLLFTFKVRVDGWHSRNNLPQYKQKPNEHSMNACSSGECHTVWLVDSPVFFCFINRWINYWCWRKPVHSTQQSAHRFATSSPHHKSSLLLFRYVLVSHRTRWCAYSCDAYVLVCVLILSVCCTWAVLVLCIVEPI